MYTYIVPIANHNPDAYLKNMLRHYDIIPSTIVVPQDYDHLGAHDHGIEGNITFVTQMPIRRTMQKRLKEQGLNIRLLRHENGLTKKVEQTWNGEGIA